ncbi:MAG TPA: hypothetical protein VGL29_23820 [Blastocatellia bacterium]
MTFSKTTLIAFLLLLLSSNLSSASLSPQMYAPVVGRWRIELSIKEKNLSLEFETDGQGVYGYGTGYCVLYKNDSWSREYPAAWSNWDPQKISISTEIVLPGERASQIKTLVLRTTLAPGQEIKGDAVMIDEKQTIDTGTFIMKRLLGPEEIMKKRR